MESIIWRKHNYTYKGETVKSKSGFTADGKLAVDFGQSEQVARVKDKDGRIRMAKVQRVFATRYIFLHP